MLFVCFLYLSFCHCHTSSCLFVILVFVFLSFCHFSFCLFVILVFVCVNWKLLLLAERRKVARTTHLPTWRDVTSLLYSISFNQQFNRNRIQENWKPKLTLTTKSIFFYQAHYWICLRQSFGGIKQENLFCTKINYEKYNLLFQKYVSDKIFKLLLKTNVENRIIFLF